MKTLTGWQGRRELEPNKHSPFTISRHTYPSIITESSVNEGEGTTWGNNLDIGAVSHHRLDSQDAKKTISRTISPLRL